MNMKIPTYLCQTLCMEHLSSVNFYSRSCLTTNISLSSLYCSGKKTKEKKVVVARPNLLFGATGRQDDVSKSEWLRDARVSVQAERRELGFNKANQIGSPSCEAQ